MCRTRTPAVFTGTWFDCADLTKKTYLVFEA